MTLDDIFEKFDAELTAGMAKKLGRDSFTLRECYANHGGVFEDGTMLRQRRLSVYAWVEFDGQDYGMSVDISRPESGCEVAFTRDNLLALAAKFDAKYNPTRSAASVVAAGIQPNVIVYDEDARPGQFTPRLIHLVMAARSHSLNPGDGPTRLLVPASARWPVEFGHVPVVGGHLWGCPVEELPGDADEEFRRQGGSFPAGKRHLVAVVQKSGGILLGAF